MINEAAICLIAFFFSPVLLHMALDGLYGATRFDKVDPLPEGVHSPPRFTLTKEEKTRPYIAWRTVGLTVMSYIIIAISWFGYLTNVFPATLSFVLCMIAYFIVFTPLHDAVHGAVSQNKYINETIGFVSGMPLVCTHTYVDSLTKTLLSHTFFLLRTEHNTYTQMFTEN
eukprot:m.351943 g.351943  ORF g.351943 m.351943 type:complete len:170 (-) comp56148_c0_seq1:26-535(-)